MFLLCLGPQIAKIFSPAAGYFHPRHCFLLCFRRLIAKKFRLRRTMERNILQIVEARSYTRKNFKTTSMRVKTHFVISRSTFLHSWKLQKSCQCGRKTHFVISRSAFLHSGKLQKSRHCGRKTHFVISRSAFLQSGKLLKSRPCEWNYILRIVEARPYSWENFTNRRRQKMVSKKAGYFLDFSK